MTSLEVVGGNDPAMSTGARRAVAKLERLARELVEREKLTRQRLDYFQGRQPLQFASPEFSRYFGTQFEGFNDNWCAPVISAPTERMTLLGVRLDTDEDSGRERATVDRARNRGVDKDLERVWRSNDCDTQASKAFVMTLAAGRSFATVWGDPDDDDTPIITFERPDQAVIEYGDRGQPITGMRLWRDDTWEYAVLDDGDYLWKFKRQAAIRDGRLRSGLVVPAWGLGGWEPRQPDSDDTWPIENPLGMPAMVELPNNDLLDRDNPMSDIDGVASMQDAINIIWAYLINALDYASLPQRVVTGADIPKIPVLDDQGQIKGYRPVELDTLIKERILWVPGSNAKIAEWSTAALDVFSSVIEIAVEHVAAQTRTPPHYLIGKITNVSADTMTAAETGLVAKTRERTVYVSPGLRGVYQRVALAQGNDAKARAIRGGTVVWDDFQFRSLGQKVDALGKLKDMGFPLEWLAEQYGLHPIEVERVMRMRDAERRDPQLDELAGISPTDDYTRRVTAVGVDIRAGFDPEGSRRAAGLPPVKHTGLLPVTVQSEEKALGETSGPPPFTPNPPATAPPPDGPPTPAPRRRRTRAGAPEPADTAGRNGQSPARPRPPGR